MTDIEGQCRRWYVDWAREEHSHQLASSSGRLPATGELAEATTPGPIYRPQGLATASPERHPTQHALNIQRRRARLAFRINSPRASQ
jgi:hypothetical protein